MTTLPTGYQTERQFQTAVIELAEWCGWQAFSLPDSRRVTAVGFPDLVLMHNTWGLLAAELKLDHTYPTRAQRRWLAAFTAYGIRTFVWRPRDYPEIEAMLKGETV